MMIMMSASAVCCYLWVRPESWARIAIITVRAELHHHCITITMGACISVITVFHYNCIR